MGAGSNEKPPVRRLNPPVRYQLGESRSHLARGLSPLFGQQFGVGEAQEAPRGLGRTAIMEQLIDALVTAAGAVDQHVLQLHQSRELTPQRAIDDSHLKEDIQEIEVIASPEELFAVVQSVGGDNGWYYGNWMWALVMAIVGRMS